MCMCQHLPCPVELYLYAVVRMCAFHKANSCGHHYHTARLADVMVAVAPWVGI